MKAAIVPLAVSAALALLASCSNGGDSPPEPETKTEPTVAIATEPAPSADPAPVPVVERVVAFSDTTHCVPAPSLSRLLADAAPLDAIGRPGAGHEPHVEGMRVGPPSIASEGTTHTLNLPLAAPWHGLQMIGITQVWTEESDHFELSLRFADPPAATIAALNRQGFALAPDGQRTESGEVMSTYLVVTRDGSGARLTCSQG